MSRRGSKAPLGCQSGLPSQLYSSYPAFANISSDGRSSATFEADDELDSDLSDGVPSQAASSDDSTLDHESSDDEGGHPSDSRYAEDGGNLPPDRRPGRQLCYCNRHMGPQKMLACGDANCSTKWFHAACVDLSDGLVQAYRWLCRDCLPTEVPRPIRESLSPKGDDSRKMPIRRDSWAD